MKAFDRTQIKTGVGLGSLSFAINVPVDNDTGKFQQKFL